MHQNEVEQLEMTLDNMKKHRRRSDFNYENKKKIRRQYATPY